MITCTSSSFSLCVFSAEGHHYPHLIRSRTPFVCFVMPTHLKDLSQQKMFHFLKLISRLVQQTVSLVGHLHLNVQFWLSLLGEFMAPLDQLFSSTGRTRMKIFRFTSISKRVLLTMRWWERASFAFVLVGMRWLALEWWRQFTLGVFLWSFPTTMFLLSVMFWTGNHFQFSFQLRTFPTWRTSWWVFLRDNMWECREEWNKSEGTLKYILHPSDSMCFTWSFILCGLRDSTSKFTMITRPWFSNLAMFDELLNTVSVSL